MNLFREELKLWRTSAEEADKNGDVIRRRMAKEMSFGLREAAVGRLGIEQMLAGITPMDEERAGSWYVVSVSTMAHSRMLQEMMHSDLTKHKDEDENFFLKLNSKAPDVCFDFLATDPHRSGFHAKEAFLQGWEDHLGIKWPETTAPEWYEGESIYLRVKRPARPTTNLQKEYLEVCNQPFIPREFASVVPRLKTEVWEQG